MHRTPIARPDLEHKLLKNITNGSLILISAPEGSGKWDLMEGLREQLTRSQSLAESIHFEPDFDDLSDTAQSDLAAQTGQTDMCHIISTCQPQPFDTARLRLNDRVTVVSLPELSLTAKDITAWLGATYGFDESSWHLRELIRKTSGWLMGWKVIAAELRNGRKLPDLAETFSGAHPDISSFLQSTVLNVLPPDLTNTLIELSALDPMEAEMAIGALGDPYVFTKLDQLACATGFVHRTGSKPIFQMHPLLRDALTDIAERRIPDRLRTIRTFVAARSEERSDWLRAAQNFLAAGDTDKAQHILLSNADELVTGRGEVSDYRTLIRSLPAAITQRLATEVALGAVFSGDFAGAAALLQDTEKGRGEERLQESDRRTALSLVIDFGFEDFDTVLSNAPDWLQKHNATEPRFRSMVAASLFFASYAELNSAMANRALSTYRDCLKKTRSPFLQGWLAIMEALHQRDLGHIVQAERVLDVPGGVGAIRPAIEVVRANIAYELGDLTRSRHLLLQHLDAGLRHSTVEVALLGWQTAMATEALDTGLDGAMRVAALAEHRVSSLHGARGKRSIRLLRAGLSLRFQRADPALAKEVEILCHSANLFGPGQRLREQAKLLHARFLALQGEPRQAISLLQPLLRESLQQSRMMAWSEATFIYAGALARLHEPKRASRLAWTAIERLSPLGLRSQIASESIMLAPILDDLVKRAGLTTGEEDPSPAIAVRDLARRAGRPIATIPISNEPSFDLEADIRLTETELKVLELAASGSSNAQIADRMMVKISTIKWHMHNIFGKLDVTSRTAAIAQARKIGLLIL